MSPEEPILPEEQAAAVWRRAAQLQAEAAQRLEERSRRQLTVPAGEGAHPEGFRLADVEAAAVEAGIAPEFVKLALAEQEAGGVQLSGWSDRAATRLLGVSQRTLEVARTIAAPPAVVFEAMQRVLPAQPYGLALAASLGDDPLNGGVLVFGVPPYNWTTGSGPFVTAMTYVDIKQLRVMLRPIPGESPATEVVVAADLRRGVRTNGWIGGGLSGVAGAGGGLVGVAVGLKGLALAGALVALPALAGVVLAGGVGALGYGALYRWCLRGATEQVEGMLQALEAHVRTRGAFSPPQGAPAAPGSAGVPFFPSLP